MFPIIGGVILNKIVLYQIAYNNSNIYYIFIY